MEVNAKGGFRDLLFLKLGVRTTKRLVCGVMLKNGYLSAGYSFNHNSGG